MRFLTGLFHITALSTASPTGDELAWLGALFLSNAMRCHAVPSIFPSFKWDGAMSSSRCLRLPAESSQMRKRSCQLIALSLGIISQPSSIY
eukprot:COSAG06_NODE_2991_length_5982_cov_9.192589_9_plen_91_part_00